MSTVTSDVENIYLPMPQDLMYYGEMAGLRVWCSCRISMFQRQRRITVEESVNDAAVESNSEEKDEKCLETAGNIGRMFSCRKCQTQYHRDDHFVSHVETLIA